MISQSLFIYETYLHLLKQTETLSVSLKMTFSDDRNDIWSSAVSEIFYFIRPKNDFFVI